MVFKTTKIIVLILALLSFVSFGSNADQSIVTGTNTKKIISDNVKFLSKYMTQANTSADYQSAANFINQVKLGYCDYKNIDAATLKASLSVIGTFSYERNNDTDLIMGKIIALCYFGKALISLDSSKGYFCFKFG